MCAKDVKSDIKMSENQQLATIRVLCLVGDAYEDLELWYPKLRIEEASGHVTLAGRQQGHEYAGKHVIRV